LTPLKWTEGGSS